MAAVKRSFTYNSQFGISWHPSHGGSVMCLRLWACWRCKSCVFVVSDFRDFMAYGAGLAWSQRGKFSCYFRSFFCSLSNMQVAWKRVALYSIWFGFCVWVLWNERNDTLFRNQQSSIPQLLEKVKSCFLWWLKASNVDFIFGTHNWWSNPLACMGIDRLCCSIDWILIFLWLF